MSRTGRHLDRETAMTLSIREYVQSDATDLARLVRSGDVSAAELLELATAQLDRLNPTLNAVNLPMLRQARERVQGPLDGTAGRGAVPDQGRDPGLCGAADFQRQPRLSQRHRQTAFGDRAAIARCRRCHHRQDQHAGTGAEGFYRSSRVRRHAQSLESRAHAGRIERWLGRRRRGRHRADGGRQ